jgi:hypothetical protein
MQGYKNTFLYVPLVQQQITNLKYHKTIRHGFVYCSTGAEWNFGDFENLQLLIPVR